MRAPGSPSGASVRTASQSVGYAIDNNIARVAGRSTERWGGYSARCQCVHLSVYALAQAKPKICTVSRTRSVPRLPGETLRRGWRGAWGPRAPRAAIGRRMPGGWAQYSQACSGSCAALGLCGRTCAGGLWALLALTTAKSSMTIDARQSNLILRVPIACKAPPAPLAQARPPMSKYQLSQRWVSSRRWPACIPPSYWEPGEGMTRPEVDTIDSHSLSVLHRPASRSGRRRPHLRHGNYQTGPRARGAA